MQPNNQVVEFNASKKNRKQVRRARAYAFISCPDFGHANGKYEYGKIRSGIPLALALASDQLARLSEEKPVEVFISDHEAYRPEVQKQLGMPQEDVLASIQGSLEAMRQMFPQSKLLSSLFPYDCVIVARNEVPEDHQMDRAVIFSASSNRSADELKESYREKYAQMIAFLRSCEAHDLCAVLMYSKFTFNLVSAIRKEIPVPVLYLDMADPH